MKTSWLISLGVLFEYGYTITLDKQDMSAQKNGQEIRKGTRNKQTGMWEVPLEIKQLSDVANNIMGNATEL